MVQLKKGKTGSPSAALQCTVCCAVLSAVAIEQASLCTLTTLSAAGLSPSGWVPLACTDTTGRLTATADSLLTWLLATACLQQGANQGVRQQLSAQLIYQGTLLMQLGRCSSLGVLMSAAAAAEGERRKRRTCSAPLSELGWSLRCTLYWPGMTWCCVARSSEETGLFSSAQIDGCSSTAVALAVGPFNKIS